MNERLSIELRADPSVQKGSAILLVSYEDYKTLSQKKINLDSNE